MNGKFIDNTAGSGQLETPRLVLKVGGLKLINYLNRGAQGIDIVALGIDFVAVRAWAQSVCRLE